MLGLETALSVVQETMVDTGLLDWAGVADRMSVRPARIGRLAGHGRPLEVGEPANLMLVDPAARHGRSTRPAGVAVAATPRTPGASCPAAWSRRSCAGRATVLEGALVAPSAASR